MLQHEGVALHTVLHILRLVFEHKGGKYPSHFRDGNKNMEIRTNSFSVNRQISPFSLLLYLEEFIPCNAYFS